MTTPIQLVLVRHGQSEGNLANTRSRAGDDSDFTPEILNRPGRSWRLTDRGRNQGRLSGQWVRDNVGSKFSSYFVSEYNRAMETAGTLGLSQAKWVPHPLLHERDWGEMEVMSNGARMALLKRQGLTAHPLDDLYWKPPGGEMLADVVTRVSLFWTQACLRGLGDSPIIVSHNEVMWAFRIMMEGLSQISFRKLMNSPDPKDRILNGQVMVYSRQDPNSGIIYPDFEWVYSVAPDNPHLSPDCWRRIDRKRYSNAELLAAVAKQKQVIK